MISEIQTEIIRQMKVQPAIEPKSEFYKRVDFLAHYLRESGRAGFVLGISGGQDSTLAGVMAQKAVESLRDQGYTASFTAMRLPYGVQLDEDDAQLALDFIQPDHRLTYDIKSVVDNAVNEYPYHDGEARPVEDYHKGNLKARTRMMAQYLHAGQEGLLVVGTDHSAEAVTGFYTIHGDGAADIVPLFGLNKRQGRQILKFIGAPDRLYLKTPTADLLDGTPQQGDEVELGISYDDIDDFLEGKQLPKEIHDQIVGRFHATAFKRNGPVTP